MKRMKHKLSKWICAVVIVVLGSSTVYAATSASVSFDYNTSNGTVDKSKLLNLARGWQGPINNTAWHNSFYGNMASIGIRELRMDWIPSDNSYHVVRRNASNNLTYDFTNLDAIILPLLKRGMRPVMCMHMAYVSALGIGGGTNDAFPSNLNDYQAVITAFVQHYKDLGYTGLSWESHNECENFTNMTAEQTYIMYDYFAHGVKAADSTALVGGPASGSDWFSYMGTFLDFYKSDTSRPAMDFFSYHQYASDTFNSVTQAVNLFTSRGLAVPPLYLTEWNDYPFTQTDNDQSQHAAYVAQKFYWAMMHASALTKIYFFNYADGDTSKVFSGANGLFTAGNHKKASANAFNMYNNLHSVRLTPTISGQDTNTYNVYSVATKDSVTGSVSLIIWNNRSTDVNVSLSLSNLPYLAASQSFVLTRYIIDGTHGNYYNDYLLNPSLSPTSTAVGASENVGVAEIATYSPTASFARTEYLPAWSVTQLRFEPVRVFNSAVDYELLSCSSGLNMQINSSSQKAEQGVYWAGDNQKWNIVDLGTGYYKIACKSSGLVLQSPGASTGSGVQLDQAAWTGGNHQQWQIVDAGSFYKILNRNSGLDAAVSGSSQAEGASIVQWTSGTGANELWKIQPAPPAPNEICRGYWKLDETTGALAYDSSGFGKHGTLAGTSFNAGSIPGKDARALNFDGVDDQVAVPALNFYSNTVTITAWVKCDAAVVPWSGIYFSRNTNANGLNIGNGRELRYHWNNTMYTWVSGFSLPTSAWTFVALVIGPGQGTIYMDSGSGLQSATNFATHYPELFGGDSYLGWDPAASNRHFRGAIDDFRIYNASLTSSQLTAIRNSVDRDPPTPNPMTWATAPYESGPGAVTMTATTASDPAGVEYYFDCVSGGGHDSGWQSSSTYTDTNVMTLSAQYRVKARDKSPRYNETSLSAAAAVTISRYPYGAQTRLLPGQIQAEEFDVAGEGLSYHDVTIGNSGGAFRPNEDVDIIASNDSDGTCCIDAIENGEWLEYTVNSTSQAVSVYLRTASAISGSQVRILLNGSVLGVIAVPNTGSVQNWTTVSLPNIILPTLSNIKLRLEMIGGGFRLNWISFKNRTPYLGSPAVVPGRIEFENYDVGGQSLTYFDTNTGNSYGQYRLDDVDILGISGSVPANYSVFAAAGEWLEYTASIQTGYYDIVVRSTSTSPVQSLELSLDGQTLAAFSLPKTGGWNAWENTVASNVFIAGGNDKILRLTLTSSSSLLDSIEFVRLYAVGDINHSGRVDLDDFSILSSQWLLNSGSLSADIVLPPNGAVDIADLAVMAENWLKNQ